MRTRIPILLLAVMVAACSSRPFTVAPMPPGHYETLGPATGGACGVLLFNLIPISSNDRVERAYAQALATSRGSMLIDTRVRERWYFIYAGTLLCTDIEGTAIR
jgi:hypothetical protein